MHFEIKAKVHKETKEGTYFLVLVPQKSLTDEVKQFSKDNFLKGELRIDDGRKVTTEQRKKIYATLADITDYSGHTIEELKVITKYRYISASGEQYFSLSNCSVTTARHFINYIIDFALEWGVQLTDVLLNRTDDINAAIYASIKHKRCVLCGIDGEIHHWDTIGMGNDRTKVDDSNHRKICLCRIHHTEAHKIGVVEFEKKYHVYGIIYKE